MPSKGRPDLPSSVVLNVPPQHPISLHSKRETGLFLAGWIDGEGCIMVQHPAARRHRQWGQFVIQVAISNTGLEALRAIREHTEGTIRYHKQGPLHWRTSYVLQFGATRCRVILPLVQPFLRVKHRQCALALEALAITAQHRSYAQRNTPASYARLTEISEEVKALNRRGRVVQPPVTVVEDGDDE